MQANLGMRYGLDDVRGYESIIPKQYVDFMGQLEPPVQLDFNRIAPLYTSYPAGINFNYVDALKSPLLGLLNVRYLITHKTTTLPTELTVSSDPRRIAPAWALVYEDEAVRIWEHGYVPRAVVDQRLDGGEPNIQNGIFPGFDVAIDRDTGREMVLHANISPHIVSWLVVSETYMPGWRAFVRPRGGDDKTERPLEVKRVMDNFIGMNVTQDVVQNIFRDIQDALPEAQRMALDAGQITVRLVYSPTSFNIGLFGSVISMALIVLLVGVWLWRLFMVTDRAQETGISRVARNSLAPIILNLFNRGIDFAFAFVMLRVLGPDNAGIYYYAAFIFGWFDIFTNFGLNTFLTREVARDRSQAGRYLWNTSLLRLLLMIIGIALLLGFLFARQSAVSPPLTQEAVIAIGLLYVGLLPNSLSTGLSAFFYAFEQAEYPAVIATVATICRAVFGVSALLLGYGVIGLAGVSIITNCITLAIMLVIARRILPGGVRIAKPDMTLFRSMLGEGFPLMLNHFLASIFFQIDVVILQAVRGDAEVGQYSVAYKWVAALNIIPAFFTMALLPVMSRQAHEDRAALKRNYHLAIKLLVCVALPTAVLFTFLAYFLTGILGGSQYLPDGAIATQLMIWSIPIGWMNSLTQYLLIALDLQRKITWAFIIAVTFNIVINLLLIPAYGYRAAAITTIASEAVLLIPFGVLMQSGMGRIQWIGMVWKPLAATAIMLTVLWVGWSVQPVAALALACVTYTVGLLVLRPLSAEEQALLLPLIPGRLRRRPAVGRSV
jgi:O-antigen/teichoic acid export membrane protein